LTPRYGLAASWNQVNSASWSASDRAQGWNSFAHRGIAAFISSSDSFGPHEVKSIVLASTTATIQPYRFIAPPSFRRLPCGEARRPMLVEGANPFAPRRQRIGALHNAAEI
jgi:hypothetical protein